MGHSLLILEVSRSHKTVHHSRLDSSGRVISSLGRPLPDNTQQSQQTNIHVPGEIRIHGFSRRAAADLRNRPRGRCDRLNYKHVTIPVHAWGKFCVVLNFLVFMCGCVILRNMQGPLNCATYDMATLCIASDCVICNVTTL